MLSVCFYLASLPFLTSSQPQRRQKLSLQLPLSQQPYLDQCLQCKETPVLLLISPIFLDAVEVDREKNVEKVLRRQTVSEGCLRWASYM